jgi:hypothetical protein
MELYLHSLTRLHGHLKLYLLLQLNKGNSMERQLTALPLP